ncbi:MAG: phosphoenolpyruvate-utilizing N-terminal domain-containing protein [Liquorilactobacillus ghanensis]|jgi:hypothetical protein|uniref:Tropomyosin n=1 Tax=Liquorilactobacillus ghanensis DSM 18630 TaxID=1423750 RepID=A0A0R1VWZ9_9LACO|nr:phosphoenolpyruvate-utilizing N-terminal domain-containing protein [Liquorilactobacillus ghanensis]KRM07571.1 hypothetical protein FC89_GL000009 [Liquorilactobacillus ghanensis DSM 18630]
MKHKRLIGLSAGIILGGIWLYQQQQKQPTTFETKDTEELVAEMHRIQTAIRKIKQLSEQLAEQLNNQKFSSELAQTLAEYQLQIEPILNKIQQLSQKFQ